MKKTLDFKNIELNEDMRDIAKKGLEARLSESISLPRYRGQYSKGYTRPFEDNTYLTEKKDSFSYRDSYLESLDLNDGGKSTSRRLKEAQDKADRIQRFKEAPRPVRRPRMERPIEEEEVETEGHGMSMQDALDAYLAKKGNLKESKETPRKGLSMQDALDAYLAKRDKATEMNEAKVRETPKSTSKKKVSTPEEMKTFLDNLIKRSQELHESTVRSKMSDILFFIVKTPSGKYLCEDVDGNYDECDSLEDAEAYESFDDAEMAVRSYADEVSEFEIKGIEATDFKDVGYHSGKKLEERRNPVKDITVDFPVSVSSAGHVKASDAKRLLKYLYSTKQLRAGTQYFIKDVNGVETNWDFTKNIYHTGYDYEFSCEVADDDRDVYQALYISKDYKGRLDWSDTEWVREKIQ